MKVIIVFLGGLLFCVAKNTSSFDKILRNENMLKDIGMLTSDLLYKLKPGHCYALITDSLYSDLLQTELFHEIGGSTYFVIRVKDNEDLQTPKNETLKVLKEAHRSGCRCYLIYLANGIQVNRFLRFVDRKRAISPRARIIILHDYRLFVTHMHYIWKRFVNVIFVRQYEQSVRRNRSSINDTMAFELTTVPFPLPIQQVFVTKGLDFWHNGRYRHGVKLNIDKTNDLKGQQMIVCVLKHTPGVLSRSIDQNESISSEPTYSGLEVEILNAISNTLNFTVEFYETDDATTEQWGMKMENGSYTGLLGEMVNGMADIALADLHYIPYHLEIMELSIPYSAQCLTFLTPESLSDNSWQTLVLPFSSDMWSGVLFFLFCVGFVFYVFEHINIWIQRNEPENKQKTIDNNGHIVNSIKFEMSETPFLSSKYIFKRSRAKKTRDIFHGFSDCILYTFSMILVVSLPRLPQKWAVRLLTGWYWIYCILIVTAYRASLTAILANPVSRLTIDTLEELANSPIECGVWGEQNRQFFLNTSDKVSNKIGEKIEIITKSEVAINRVSQGKFAYYENVYFLKEMRAKHDQIESNKLKYLHIMKECAINMPISIGFEKNSPMTPSFNRLLRHLMEGGFISKWLSDSVQRFEASEEDPPEEAVMNLEKLYGVLFAMLIGYSIALLALIGENLYWRFVTKRNPLYDKYDPMKFYNQ